MITITSLWIVTLAVLLFFLARSVRTARRALRCPILGTEVQVKFLEALPEGRPMEVAACSAFKPPTNIVCDQRCLRLLHPHGDVPDVTSPAGLQVSMNGRSTHLTGMTTVGDRQYLVSVVAKFAFVVFSAN